MININLDIDSKFWGKHPEVDVIFNEERKLKYSDKIMWSIFLFAHPRSKFTNLDDETKIDIISKDYLGTIFDPSKYASTIQKLRNSLLSPIERTFVVWDQKFKEREKFLEDTKYSAATYQMIDKMMADTFQMKKQFDSIMAEFQKEKSDKTFGDIEESLSEKGII